MHHLVHVLQHKQDFNHDAQWIAHLMHLPVKAVLRALQHGLAFR